ncbi:MAG: gliding motility-associated C-terminal domain-containing protein [Saprospiraceae bacterium]
MRNHNLKTVFTALWLLLPLLLLAQPNDCRKAIVICDDRPILFTPRFGAGSNDFLSSKNNKGCLQRGENISVWFYFELRKDMPADSGKLAFTITDSVQIRGQDYDFAIYGPQTTCDSLGAPIRCSFAQINPNQRVIRTGLGNGASDRSEGLDGDGFLDTLRVKPGDGYFLLVDFFVGVGGSSFDSAVALSFNLTWKGPAAPYLNCIANPNCDLVEVQAKPDTSVCAGTSFTLRAGAVNTAGRASVRWTATGDAPRFIESADSFSTRITIPPGTSGLYTFTATVTEGNCVHSDEMLVNVLPAPVPSITGDSIICGGKRINLTATLGFERYVWSTGETRAEISVADVGAYEVTVTDSKGCSGAVAFQVKDIVPGPPSVFGDTILCPGEQTFLAAESGYATYEWNNGSREEVAIILTPGIYTVTVTDSNGCIATRKVEVTGVLPQIPVITGDSFFCAGKSVQLFVQSAFLTYNWSNGTQDSMLTVSTPGVYRLTVTDENGCTSNTEFRVGRRENPIAFIEGDSLFCSGGSTLLKAPPGYARYLWTGGSSDSLLRVSSPGRYTLMIEDLAGCSASASILADTLSLPSIAFTGPSTFCEGEFSRISPGNFATYQWSTGEIFPDIVVNRSGDYRVTVSGFNGCTAEGTYTITVFPNPRPIITAPSKICQGTQAILRVEPQFAKYTWDSGDSTATIQKSSAGTYAVTVTDTNGCSGSAAASMDIAPQPEVRIRGKTQICAGDTTRLSADPGFPSYTWSTGAREPSILAYRPGIYTVGILDSNGCTASDTLLLQVLDNPPIGIGGPLRFCSGSFTTLKVPAGYQQYAWSNGSADSLIRVTASGRYSVTVTNARGCMRSSEVLVQSDSAIAPLLLPGNYSVCKDTFKRFEAGPGFISYTWSDGSTKPYLEVSKAGDYSLTVLDSNFCITSVAFSVSVPIATPPVILGPDSICQGVTAMLIAIGSGYRSYLWSTGDRQSTTSISQGGLYRLQVVDQNGCTTSATKNLGTKPAPEVKIVGDLEICRGESTTLAVTGKFLAFEWSNSSKDSTLTISQPGPYGVSAIGQNGCIGSDEVVVRLSRIPFPIIDGDRFFCTNDSLPLEVEAGFESYTWSTGQSGNRIFVSREGTYGVTVTDDLGCAGKAQVRVFTIPSPEAKISGSLIFCPGDSVLLTAGEGYPGYQWSPGPSGIREIWVKAPGWYTLKVEAENRCTDRDSVLVRHAPVPAPEIIGKSFFCADSAAFLAIQDTFPVIRWSTGQNTPQITPGAPGLYAVSVANSNGCTGRDTFSLSRIPAPVADAGRDTFLTCTLRDVALTGSLPLLAGGPLKATWEGPGINAGNRHSPAPRVSTPGSYQLILTDTLHSCPSLPDVVLLRDSAYSPSVAVFAEDSLNCASPAIFLNGRGSETGKNIVYSWRQLSGGRLLGSDSLRAQVELPGDYALIVTDTALECSSARTLRIGIDTVAPQPSILPPDTLTCARSAVTLYAAPPPQGQKWAFNWPGRAGSPADFSPSNTRFIANLPGRYALNAQNLRNGCIGSAAINVPIDSVRPIAKGGADAELDCLSREITLVGEAPDSRWQYQWRDSATGFILARIPTITLELPGTLFYEVIDPKNGCTAKDTVIVRPNGQVPIAVRMQSIPETCAGRSDGQLRIAGVEGGTPPFVYRLSGSTAFSTTRVFTALRPGTYRLTLQDANGCELSERFDILPGITANLSLGGDLTIKLGERIQINGLTNIPAGALAKVQWTKPDTLKTANSLSVGVMPLQTTAYFATVQDTNGCSASDSLTIFVERTQRVYFPSAFSPNGDGANDVFMVFSGPETLRVKSLRLFNRWGTQVYEQFDFPPNDPAFGWDGVHRGTIQNPAVYVYLAEVIFLDGSEAVFKGDFTLIR